MTRQIKKMAKTIAERRLGKEERGGKWMNKTREKREEGRRVERKRT